MISEQLQLETTKRTAFHDIGELIQNVLAKHKAKTGFVIVRTMHTTGAVVINEKEAGLLKDAEVFLEKLIPDDIFYHHDDFSVRTIEADDEYKRANAFSHLRAMLLGSETVIPFIGGKLSLGRFQSVFFVELDGPRRSRKIEILIS